MNDYLIEFKQKLEKCNSINECMSEFENVNKSGIIFELKNQIITATIEEKKEIGPKLQEMRKSHKEILDSRIKQIQEEKEKDDFVEFDPSIKVDSKIEDKGSLHPITLVENKLYDILSSLGFDIFNGGSIQSQEQNFTIVGTPNHHPARGMQDTFFIDEVDELGDKKVMRTQVTANIGNYVQNVALDKNNFRVAFPGLAYRAENMDATHDINFHQLDFWMVGKNYTNAQLFDLIKHILSEFFEEDIKLRFRPSYFPFTQPSFEVDMYASWFKGGKWLEIAGCGPIHSQVMKNLDIDSEKYSGLATGFGLTRLAQLKLGITGLPQFYNGNLRFTKGS